MAVSEAQKKANAAWNRKQDNIMIRPTKEHGAKIRAAADASGLSLQQYILRAVDNEMERESTENDGN